MKVDGVEEEEEEEEERKEETRNGPEEGRHMDVEEDEDENEKKMKNKDIEEITESTRETILEMCGMQEVSVREFGGGGRGKERRAAR